MSEDKLPEETIDWDAIFLKIPVGTKVCGKIKFKPPFGIFIEIEFPDKFATPMALLEIICIGEIPSEVDTLIDKLQIGDTICAMVTSIDRQSGIRLTTKKTEIKKYGFSESFW